ncbi:MAG: ATP-binding protein [Gammaproteobacteria bacterium]|nr:ATP-binding protein [Gammaproteobacteria bacterium]
MSPGRGTIRVHVTAVAVGPHAVLLRGPSGSGKSDLALRMLALPAEAVALAFGHVLPVRLVADDQIDIAVVDGEVTTAAPATIAGLMEVRGVGVVSIGSVDGARVRLIADLLTSGSVERLPEPDAVVEFCGISLPHLHVAALEASAPLKVLLALARAVRTLDAAR